MINKKLLIDSANEIGIKLSKDQVDKFDIYSQLLIDWGSKINLTKILKKDEIILKHFIDSLTINSFLNDFTQLLDIGSGGGFPGVPIAIYRQTINVNLIESSSKKASFLKELVRNLGIDNLKVFNIRAEQKPQYLKNSMDYVAFRAFGKIDEIVKLSGYYLKKNGKLLIMKGKNGLREYETYINMNNTAVRLVDVLKLELPVIKDSRIILSLELL